MSNLADEVERCLEPYSGNYKVVSHDVLAYMSTIYTSVTPGSVTTIQNWKSLLL